MLAAATKFVPHLVCKSSRLKFALHLDEQCASARDSRRNDYARVPREPSVAAQSNPQHPAPFIAMADAAPNYAVKQQVVDKIPARIKHIQFGI